MAKANSAVNLVEQFANNLRVSTPILQVRTADANSVAARVTEANPARPVVQWDASAGFNARTKAGVASLAQIVGKQSDPVLNAADAVYMARNAADETILFIFNAHKLWNDVTTLQGIWNLRDSYKAHQQMVVLLTTPEAQAPRELETDLIVINDPLPDDAQIEKIISTQCLNSQPPLPVPDKTTMAKAVDALKGLPPFVAEQLVSLSLTRKGVNIPELRTRKKQTVNDTPGAKVYEGTETFADIGGHEGLKKNLRFEINGKKPIKVVVICDEFEKMMAGGSSDHVGDGGVAKDASQVFLTNMQDYKMRGAILFGHPGAGKTVVAKALGNEADCLVIVADMGAMKGGIVGESEARVRAFFTMVNAIAGEGGAMIIATCNSTGAITTEMRRRFKSGFYFVDLPDRDEKDSIWAIQMKRYNVPAQKLPNDEGWTGYEIEVCCEKADNYGISLIEAAKQIVPVAKSQPELITRRRAEANGSMLSAATGLTYVMPQAKQAEPTMVTGSGRRVTVLES